MEHNKPKVVSLFAGIGGFDLGFARSGFEIVAHVEKDENCRKLLAAKWPDAVTLDDVCTAGAHNLPECDVVVGGSPCQGFSVAGKRKGRKDERSNLTTEFVRICDELHPDFVVWENVPGVLSMRDNAFGHFLAAMVGANEPFERADGGSWTSAGVVVGPARVCGWRVLDAQWFGVAQRRRRVFLVGVAQGRDGGESGERAGIERVIQVLFEPKGLCRDYPPRREAWEGVAGCLESRTGGGGFPGTDGACAGHVVPAVAGCLQERNAKDIRTPTGGIDREDMHTLVACPLTVNPYGDHASREGLLVPEIAGCLQEQDAKGADSDTKPGHLIPVAFSCKDSGSDAGEVSPTLRTMGHAESHANGGGQVAVAFGLSERTRNGGSVFEVEREPIMPALKTGSQRQQALAVAFKPSHFTRGKDGAPGDVFPPLSADADKGDQEAVVMAFQPRIARNGRGNMGDVVNALQAQSGRTGKGDAAPCVAFVDTENFSSGNNDNLAPSLRHGKNIVSVATAMAVRRLTPTECERLQGFPDGWTAGFSDSTRYRMLGNAVAAPVAEWIASRIAKVIAADSLNEGEIRE